MTKTDDIAQAYAEARPQSAAWHARARAALGGTVGHDVRHFEPVPMYITRGESGRKWDVDGNEYIDFLLGNGALLLGHSPPEVVEAIGQALVHGTHFGNDHPLHIEWGEIIVQLVPSAAKVRFVNSGTEGVRCWHCVSAALLQGRTRSCASTAIFTAGTTASSTVSSHPLTLMARSACLRRSGRASSPHQLTTSTGSRRFCRMTATSPPSSSSRPALHGGRIPCEADFLRGLRELTSSHGVVLIFDEVVTGFRLSPGGAEQYFGITPDLSCFAKIVAGGMPGGAVTGGDDIMSLFDFTGDAVHDRHGRVVHYGTFNASPLSAAAGIACLKQIATGEPTKKADALAARLREKFEDVLERYSIAGYVYGISSVFHVFFETDATSASDAQQRSDLHTTNPQKLKGMSAALIGSYQRHLRHHGVDNMSSTGGLLSSVHTQNDIDEATDAFEKTILALVEEELILKL